MEQEILQTLLMCIEKHPEESDNKKWFIRLIQNSLSGNNDPEIDIDLIYKYSGRYAIDRYQNYSQD